MAERRDIATRFQNRNPGGPGRPKGSKSLTTRLKEYLDGAKIGDEKLKRKQVADEVVEQLAKLATGRESKACLSAIHLIFDRVDGKPQQAEEAGNVTMEDVAEMEETDARCDPPDADEPPPEVQARPEPVQ